MNGKSNGPNISKIIKPKRFGNVHRKDEIKISKENTKQKTKRKKKSLVRVEEMK